MTQLTERAHDVFPGYPYVGKVNGNVLKHVYEGTPVRVRLSSGAVIYQKVDAFCSKVIAMRNMLSKRSDVWYEFVHGLGGNVHAVNLFTSNEFDEIHSKWVNVHDPAGYNPYKELHRVKTDWETPLYYGRL